MGKRKLTKEAVGKTTARRKTPRAFWGIAGAAALIIAGVVGYMVFDAGRRPEAKAGKTAPDFSLKLFNGQALALSDLKGRPILINFWSST